jgi:hypothetical protein
MATWEYMAVDEYFGPKTSLSDWIQSLNRLGQQGCEVVGNVMTFERGQIASGRDLSVLLAKRQLD